MGWKKHAEIEVEIKIKETKPESESIPKIVACAELRLKGIQQ